MLACILLQLEFIMSLFTFLQPGVHSGLSIYTDREKAAQEIELSEWKR